MKKARTGSATRAAFLVAVFATVLGCSPAPDTSSAADNGPGIVPVPFPGGQGSGQPRLTVDPNGQAVLSWLEPDGEGTALRFARFEDRRFGEPAEVVSGERFFVNWADTPSVTPVDSDLWFAHWLQFQPDSRGAYDIKAAISRDGGATWLPAEQMNDDMAEAEHGFVRLFTERGQIETFWLDGRELANFSFDNPDAFLGTSLRLARYDEAGRVTNREIVDEIVCDCCQPDAAMTAAGPIVIFRDRTENEIRDVVVRRWQGNGWTPAVNLGNEGWQIEACPVNGPVIAARGSMVAAAWYTAPDFRGRVRLARSNDGGETFSPAQDIDANGAYGQPALVLDDDGRVVLAWWRRAERGGIDLVVQAVSAVAAADAADVVADANVGLSSAPVSIIAHEDIGQPVSVPQMVRAGDAYLVAWATFDDGGAVRVAELRL